MSWNDAQLTEEKMGGGLFTVTAMEQLGYFLTSACLLQIRASSGKGEERSGNGLFLFDSLVELESTKPC